MRIYDEDGDKRLDRVTLFLTRAEAKQMADFAAALLRGPMRGNHQHVSQDDMQKEVTLCIYDPDQLDNLNLSPRSLRLLTEDI